MHDLNDEEMTRIESRPVTITGISYIAPLKGFMWVMIDDIANKLAVTHDEVLERICNWYPMTPFEGHPDDPWGAIGHRVIQWWNGLIYGAPSNQSEDDPRWHNYRQAIDPDLIDAITKSKS